MAGSFLSGLKDAWNKVTDAAKNANWSGSNNSSTPNTTTINGITYNNTTSTGNKSATTQYGSAKGTNDAVKQVTQPAQTVKTNTNTSTNKADNTASTYKTTDVSNYAPTSDAATNSALWNKVQNDSSLTQEQKTQLQSALHQANVDINVGQTFDSSTGKWSGTTTQEQPATQTPAKTADTSKAVTEQPAAQTQATNVDRNTYWDSAWNQYGTSGNFADAANKAAEAGDAEAAARIQLARNQFLAASGLNYQPETNYIREYEVTKSAESTYGNVTSYVFTTVDGQAHYSARYSDGTPVENGYSFTTTEDVNGTKVQTTYTWTSDGYRDDTGNWSESTSVVGNTNNNNTYTGDFWNTDLANYIANTAQEGSNAQVEAVNAATKKAILELEADLENSKAEYDAMADEAYLQSQQNQDNLVLQNAAAGNTGGIAQKQYTTAQASYDQQLLSISLQYQNLVNTTNQKIAQLEAEGQYEAAAAVADWAQTKLNEMTDAYKWYEELKFEQEQFDYEKEVTDRNYAYQRAVSMLEQGMLTSDALTTLGISESDAKAYTNRLNVLADLNLQEAKAELAQIAKSSTGTVADETYDTGNFTNAEYVEYQTLLANDQLPIKHTDGKSEMMGAIYNSATGGYSYTGTLAEGDTTTINGKTFYWNGSDWTREADWNAQKKAEQDAAAKEQFIKDYQSLTGYQYSTDAYAKLNLQNSLNALQRQYDSLTQQLSESIGKPNATSIMVERKAVDEKMGKYQTLLDQLQ